MNCGNEFFLTATEESENEEEENQSGDEIYNRK